MINEYTNLETYKLLSASYSTKQLHDSILNACACGRLDILIYAVENGAQTDNQCLELAIINCHEPIVRYLIDNGIQIEGIRYPIEGAYIDNPLLAKLLLTVLTPQTKHKDLFKSCASFYGPMDAFLGCKFNGYKNIDEYMRCASKYGNLELVQYLIRNTKNITWEDLKHPLVYSTRYGCSDIMRYILKQRSLYESRWSSIYNIRYDICICISKGTSHLLDTIMDYVAQRIVQHDNVKFIYVALRRAVDCGIRKAQEIGDTQSVDYLKHYL